MALDRIKTFSADHGGTNINEPMKMAQNFAAQTQEKSGDLKLKTRVFILTDGQVHDREAVFETIRT